MHNKRNDEWGTIIQKQLEIDEARNALERARYKQQQEEYKKQLDTLLSIKKNQKQQLYQQKSQDIREISTQVLTQAQEELQKRQQKLEYHKKIVEENLKLQALHSSQKDQQKHSILELEIHNNELDRNQYLQSLGKMHQHRRSAEVGMNLNLKLVQDKNYLKKKAEIEEKQTELHLAKLEELRFQQRDLEHKVHLNKIQEIQNKKQEIFSKNIAPQLMVKEMNYQQWVTHSEEVKRQEEAKRMQELEKRKEKDSKVVAETLKWQSEDKNVRKFLTKENEKVLDEELHKRIELSVRVDEDRNLKKKMEILSYREELLQQAAADKARRQAEFKLSEREKNLNKAILHQDKSTLLRGANEILKSVDLGHRLSPLASPSLKNTTLQLSLRNSSLDLA